MILHYVHYCHRNLKKCRQDTRSCVVANVAYLSKVYIRNYFHGVIVILKNSRISAKMIKTEGPAKNKIEYMKHIKIQLCHLGIIFTPEHMVWKRQQCVCIHIHITRYHTGNVYCNLIISDSTLRSLLPP